MTKKILLVDGMALLFRGYYATAYRGNFMRNEAGIPTNGVYQFLRYFLDGMNTFHPSHIICCWDMGSKTFRTEMYPDYKANRQDPPEELVPQYDLVKRVVDLFHIPNIGLTNFEADDIIGTIASQYKDEAEIIIQTGDYDMLQLVQSNVNVAIMKKGIGNYDVFNMENFLDKKGILPHQILDFKGFTGDAADNYPGVKGIGEKTALKLLQQFDNIEEIMEHKEKLTAGIRKKLEENLDMFHMSKQLAEIKRDVPIECELQRAKVNYEPNEVEEGLQSLGISVRTIAPYL